MGSGNNVLLHHEPEPDAGREEIEEQNHDAHGGAVPEAVLLVGFERIPVIGKAQKTPDGEHQIGFNFQ